MRALTTVQLLRLGRSVGIAQGRVALGSIRDIDDDIAVRGALDLARVLEDPRAEIDRETGRAIRQLVDEARDETR